jgi:type I restriction enzyme, S subunit
MMSEQWPVEPLGNVCDIIGGATPSKRKSEYYGGQFNWVTIRDMNVDYIESTQSTVTQDAIDSCSTKVVPSGTVLIATRVGLGKACILSKDACFNQDIKAIIPKIRMEIDHKFLFYWFRSISDVIINAGTGATVQGVRIPFVKQLPFPILPLEEQQTIVNILDEALDNIRENKKHIVQNLKNIPEISQSILNSIMMSEQWPLTKLGDIIGLEYGKPLPKDDRDPEGEFPVYGANGEKARSNKFYHSTPTIIVGRKGSAGELNLTEGKFWPLDVTYFVTFDDEKYEMKFIYYLLQTLNLPSMAKGVKPGINRNDVYALEVRIPPKEEQKRIVSILDEAFENINGTEILFQKTLHLNEKLGQSILQEAFNGNLTKEIKA